MQRPSPPYKLWNECAQPIEETDWPAFARHATARASLAANAHNTQPWKFQIYNTILSNKTKPINEITKEVMQTDMRKYGNATIGFIQSLYRKINELQPVVPRERQIAILNESKSFLELELNCAVSVVGENNHEKAKQSTPQKPGILLE